MKRVVLGVPEKMVLSDEQKRIDLKRMVDGAEIFVLNFNNTIDVQELTNSKDLFKYDIFDLQYKLIIRESVVHRKEIESGKFKSYETSDPNTTSLDGI